MMRLGRALPTATVLTLIGLGLVALLATRPVSYAAEDAEDAATETPTEKATFAGGCFWCMEPPFDVLNGVLSTTSGYSGGDEPDPTYKDVSAGRTTHAEVVQVVYVPSKIGYRELLDVFWKNVDPTTRDRQFCDKGSQYRTAIFYHDDEQRRLAEASKSKIEESGQLHKPIVTEIATAKAFYPAEEYHQDYYQKNPIRYKFYRNGCGRDRTLERIWGEAPAH